MSKSHTNKAYENELQLLNDKIILIATQVEKIIDSSIQALSLNDVSLAYSTIDFDKNIDKEELLIDEQCIEMLARRQPLGEDLRFIVSVLKMVTDFERMGDLAVNICQRVIKLNPTESELPIKDIKDMAKSVQAMIKTTMKAFLNRDAKIAASVLKEDDSIDTLYHDVMRSYIQKITSKQKDTENIFHLLFIAKWLERIGDHCTNLAELIIFMVEGEDVRHSQSYQRKEPLAKV